MPAERDGRGRFSKATGTVKDEAQREVPKSGAEKFLATAHARFKRIAEAEAKTRQDSLDDIQFSIGEQWPTDIRTQRETEGRPCLTMNRLPQFIRQVTNEQRQQRPAVQVNPVGDGGSVKRAQIREGIIRHIEVSSEAEIADDNAFDWMVRGGFGWERVVTEEIDHETLEQEIRIKWVRNPFCVYAAPCDSVDGSDRDHLFMVQDIPVEEYKELYPDSAAAGLKDFTSLGDRVPEWADKEKNTLRIAEYFYSEGVGRDRKIKWALINAIEVLEGNNGKTEGRDWPGMYIPFCRVVGDELEVNGRKHLAGLVRHAKDPQKMYNYWNTAATETATLAPKAPWVIAEGQIENHEEEWRMSNRKNTAALTYKGVDIAGHPVPPPQRNSVEPPIQAFSLMIQRCDLDLQACTGIFNPALGKANSEQQSGVAIGRLQKQSDIATLNFSDNMARMIRFRGRILLDLIPKIYDTARIMRIINPDSTIRQVITHVGAPEDAQALVDEEQGIKEIIDLGEGEYDCTVAVGPSFQTKRQEAAQTQLDLLKLLPPQIAQNLLDLVVRNMDIPQSDVMADRLKKQLPPQILMGEEGGADLQTQVQQLQSQLNATLNQNQLLQKANTDMLNTLKNKMVEQQGKMDLEQLKIFGQVLIAEIEAKSQDAQQRQQMYQDFLSQFQDKAHEASMQAMQQAGQFAQQGQQQQAQAAADAGQRSHEREMQIGQQAHEQGMAFTNAALQPQPAQAQQ